MLIREGAIESHGDFRLVGGSLDTAKRTAELLRQVVSHQRLPATGQAAALLDAIKNVGRRLTAGNPIELAVGNVVKRVLHIIREEDASLSALSAAGADSDASGHEESSQEHEEHMSAVAAVAANRSTLRAKALHMVLDSALLPQRQQESSSLASDSDKIKGEKEKVSRSWKLKHNVIEGINELITEIDDFPSQVAEQALEHIHQNEVILTVGRSYTLLSFLLEARKKRSFQVVVAEGAPRYEGHVLAQELSAAGVQTTAITDSAVYAMMARCNMVIIAAHAVMANGGVVAPTGCHMAALAARQHAVPFVVLAGVFKLCPEYPHNASTMLNDMRSPAEVIDNGDISDLLDTSGGGARLDVLNPTYDFIPSELVSLFITDTGGHNPSYVYRLVAEYYSPEDYSL
eukprot:jgi/Mesen1/2488/ME000159S01624